MISFSQKLSQRFRESISKFIVSFLSLRLLKMAECPEFVFLTTKLQQICRKMRLKSKKFSNRDAICFLLAEMMCF